MAQTAQLRKIEAIVSDAERVFAAQRKAYLANPYPSLEERKQNLTKLENMLVANVDEIAAAVTKDFGHRCPEETKLLEVFTSVDGIRFNRKKLAKWMKPQRRHVSPLFFTGRNTLVPQPKGIVGIVVPWNYPLFLAISPLTSALAAGNRVMIKMAANSRNLRELLAKKIAEIFPQDLVAVLPNVSGSEFSSLPFDHIIFTGSADSGRTVMKSAAENLTPVTLELGGKSPTVVCEDFDIEKAADRILYAKYVNAGQTCLAPDYVFVPEAQRDAFVAAAKRIMTARYPDPNDPSYTSVIDEKSYRRLRATLEDAERKGAKTVKLVENTECNDELRKIPPTAVLDATDEMTIMQEEIFGPLLPVRTYRSLDEVIKYVNSKDRPLGFYFFTNDPEVEKKLLYSTISGGVTINNCVLHIAQHDMPFGGVGASGIGHYHGYEGFVELSKMRPVFKNPKMPGVEMFYPPYKKRHTTLFNFLLKYGR
jgi:coniferyl-aldehyde dehydrogenase